MDELTPLVEPLSIDEAFLDLSGTEALHRAPPAQVLARFARRRRDRDRRHHLGRALSHNKFLAKIASDLDKPRGFAVIGKAETVSFLARPAGQPDLRRRQGVRRDARARMASTPSASCRTRRPKT